MNLAIINGKVLINGSLRYRNLLINNSKIVDITKNKISATKMLDVKGKVIIPGLIDCHVHLRDPGFTNKEDFKTGTSAAAAGGVTTVLDMPNTDPATTNLAALKKKRELASRKAIVNYGFFMGGTKDNFTQIKDAKNIAGVKLYMGSSTGNLLVTDKSVIGKFFNSNLTIVHAENEELLQKNAAKYKDEDSPTVHSKIRDNSVEATAVKQALQIAKISKNNRIHLTHISTKESIGIIRAAKLKNHNITCDVTPHHLFLNNGEMKIQRNFVKMNPPLREPCDVAALWSAINDGTIDCIATDHAPHTKEEKEDDYLSAPSGVPGLETMLPLLLDAVNKSRLTLKKLIELTSENPARIFSIKNRGKLDIGLNADIAIVDMNLKKEVVNKKLYTKCKWSPFNGWTLKGWPIITLVNGQIVYKNNSICGQNGQETYFN